MVGRGRHDGGMEPLAARAGALLPPAEPGGGGRRLAAPLLAFHRQRPVRLVPPSRRRKRRLPRILLSGHGHPGGALRGDLLDDLDHRGPPGRLSQGVLAAPVPRAAIAAGKVLGGATLAWLQGAAFLLLAPLAGLRLHAPALLEAAGVLALLAVALTAIGFAFAWSVDSVQGFHAVMNLILVPLWLLSGAVFPLTGAPAWLAALMRIDPLTYGVAALRWTFYGPAAALGEGIPGPAAALAILAALGAVAFAADLWVMRRGRVE